MSGEVIKLFYLNFLFSVFHFFIFIFSHFYNFYLPVSLPTFLIFKRGATAADKIISMERQSIFAIAALLGLVVDDEVVDILLDPNSVVAMGNSGGKDSCSMGLLVNEFLKRIGYRGKVIFIHSDLGEIEHAESLPHARLLAAKTGIELVVVYPLHTMLARWEKRWRDNVKRYTNLLLVKLIAPFSDSNLKFCTSEEKVQPITRELRNLFPGRRILNAVGLRREESKSRAAKPVSQSNDKLCSTKNETSGRDWFPILDLKIEEVLLTHRRFGFPLHAAYGRGNSRVSCSFCVLSSENDLRVSLKDARNFESFTRIVELEIKSGFSFQSSRWLADIGRDYTTEDQKVRLAAAKTLAERRRLIEKTIPADLLLVKNFPQFQPSMEQSAFLAAVRFQIGELYGFDMNYATVQGVYDRYAELLILKDEREKKKAKKIKAAEKKAKSAKAKIEREVKNIESGEIESIEIAESFILPSAMAGQTAGVQL